MTQVKTRGDVQLIIERDCGSTEVIEFPNTVLRKGREALAASLANEVEEVYNFYIHRMLFGDGGTSEGQTRFVNTSRNGLFGITRASKPVIASIDPNIPSQAVFTSVVSFSEANGYTLNEMALQMGSGDLYSMVTFPDLTKTEQMQLVFNWRISVV